MARGPARRAVFRAARCVPVPGRSYVSSDYKSCTWCHLERVAKVRIAISIFGFSWKLEAYDRADRSRNSAELCPAFSSTFRISSTVGT